MAAPTITSVDFTPPITGPLAPGQSVDGTLVVADADTRAVELKHQVRNVGDTEWGPEVISTLQVADTVESQTTVVSGGGTLVPTGPLTFRYTA